MRVLAIIALIISAGLILSPVQATEWRWDADNHTGNTSYFTDGVTKFKMETEPGWAWCWDDPAPGTVSLRCLGKRGRGNGFSSDFGEALDIDKGVTIAARVKPVNEASGGTLCLSVANSSTADLPDGSTCIWVGWDLPDMVLLCTRCGTTIRSFPSSVEYEGTWCIWTLSAKQIGDAIAWDIWINGVHQGADQKASDGTLHTAVLTDSSDMATTVNIGQRERTGYSYDTAWDYVAISNEGVIPGWNGSPAGTSPPPVPIEHGGPSFQERYPELAAQAGRAKAYELYKRGRWSEVVEVCNSYLRNSQGINPGTLADLMVLKASSLVSNGQLDEAIDAVGAVQQLGTSPDEKAMAQALKGDFYMQTGKYREAIETYQEVINSGATHPELQAGVRFKLALCYQQTDEVDKARIYLREIGERYPKTSWSAPSGETLKGLEPAAEPAEPAETPAEDEDN